MAYNFKLLEVLEDLAFESGRIKTRVSLDITASSEEDMPSDAPKAFSYKCALPVFGLDQINFLKRSVRSLGEEYPDQSVHFGVSRVAVKYNAEDIDVVVEVVKWKA